MAASGAQRKLDLTQTSKGSKLLCQQFANKVVGQEKATQALVDIFEAHQAGFGDSNRPAGNALFLGPTGTGKTHVVESFAEALFGNKRACIRVDCAEFQHSHEIAKLVGSPPGYLGHRETSPVFTQELLAKYHTDDLKLSVVLFDEVEKASDSLWSLLLGILDNATLTLGDNKKVDFSKVIIVMTSNLGSAEMLNRDIGFAEITEERDQARLEQIALSAVKSKFTPEFLNRIQNIVTFMTLTKEQIEQILEFELRDLASRLFVLSSPIVVANELGLVPPKNVVPRFQFAVSPCARRRLIEEGYDKAYGARHIKRAVERCIQKPLSKLVLSDQVRTDDTIIIDYCVGSGFEFYAQGQPEPPIDTTKRESR